MDWVKKHPKIALAAGVGVAAILVLSLRGGGGGGGAVVYGGPSDAVTAAQAGAYAATVQSQAELNARALEIRAQENVAMASGYYDDRAHSRESAIAALMINRQTEVALRQQDRDIAIANIGATLGHAQVAGEVQIAQIQHLTDIETIKSEREVAKKQAAEATKQNRSNAIAKIIGGIFSDAELKTDIQFLFCDAKGQRWYRYRYQDDHAYHYGVLAQETNPAYVSRQHGALAVDYQGLAAA